MNTQEQLNIEKRCKKKRTSLIPRPIYTLDIICPITGEAVQIKFETC